MPNTGMFLRTIKPQHIQGATLPYFINDEIKDAINKYGYARFRII